MIGNIFSNTMGESGENAGDGKRSGDANLNQIGNGNTGMDVGNKLYSEGEKFMHLLEEIVEGPLMKYWTILQENKL